LSVPDEGYSSKFDIYVFILKVGIGEKENGPPTLPKLASLYIFVDLFPGEF